MYRIRRVASRFIYSRTALIRGRLLTNRWRQPLNAVFGTESITLSDGFSIIGITKALHK
jgi:hypothetical protein